MALYAVIGLDHPPHSMSRREASRQAHRTYVLDNREAIRFVGVMLDDDNNQCGSFYLFEADNEQVIREWLREEPFFQTEVYERVVVRRFMLGHNALALQPWGGAAKPQS
jgi:uncharacterized protein YciI